MRYDIAIVGAGIAGASLAAELAAYASVVMLEAEDSPGYHATGRSAAFWSETYGGPAIQPLTTASGAALRNGGFLDPMGALHIGRAADRRIFDALYEAFAASDVVLTAVDPADHVPGLRPEWTMGMFEPSCAYIDVAALHADFLARARKHGTTLLTRAALRSATRDALGWIVESTAGAIRADILVDAAGAWADPVAQRAGAGPLGIRPFRRTVAQIRTTPVRPDALPIVIDIGGGFYFKPEAGGQLWLTPHDESPTDPCDAAPEEIDVAIAIDRFEGAVDWRVDAVERKWAGLRSFAPDRRPVYGFDRAMPGFFWCVGQGEFGIQTAPAAARLAAALILGHSSDPGIDPALYDPARFE